MRRSEAESLKQQEQKKKTIDAVKFVILGSCAIFTAFSLLILIPQLTSNNNFIDPMRFFLIYPFSLCVAIGNLVFKAKTLNMPLKLVIHGAITVLSFYVFMCTSLKNSNPAVLIILFAVVYIIVASIVLLIRKLTTKKTVEKPKYQSMFGNTSKPGK